MSLTTYYAILRTIPNTKKKETRQEDQTRQDQTRSGLKRAVHLYRFRRRLEETGHIYGPQTRQIRIKQNRIHRHI